MVKPTLDVLFEWRRHTGYWVVALQHHNPSSRGSVLSRYWRITSIGTVVLKKAMTKLLLGIQKVLQALTVQKDSFQGNT